MESQRQALRTAAGFLTLMLCACASPTHQQLTQVNKPVEVGITQVGYDRQSRYVYCELSACPGPTPKTLPEIHQLPQQLKSPANPSSLSVSNPAVDVAFPFNSSKMSQADIDLLKKSAKANADAAVEIIARSDFVGPAKGQQLVANARAQAMRSVVAEQAPGARIVESLEIAGPSRVPAVKQSHQRRGSVRFIKPNPNPSLQGETQ